MEKPNKGTLPTEKRPDTLFSSCLQCKPCGGGCKIVDNRVSFVFDPEQKSVSHLILDAAPKACLGRCGRSCQTELRLVQTLELRTTVVEPINTFNMSITDIISNENVTLVQGVNGICLCEESWVTSRQKLASQKKNRSNGPTEAERLQKEKEVRRFLQSSNEYVDFGRTPAMRK
ncbi:hypothetical protein [Bacteroides reticulotermitis]|uniref:hypothetical protein n=1 Tax=Bacteroides reticulotermitis TaxID=1133319 RepID=UPI003A8A25F0